ncbi:uncharacterized protein LOC117431925 isoform X1 [Acipenser ruthenus]|uniref:uncharacterized protein LOC117431925 isoform X1 n=1 Tax=Acipenser ruthenus TaxID=7906 RepID=UPI002740AD4E|nr:uncharacterized protein LOC117431925 isoform X1 [Acipenser ruthenus]
MQEFQSNGICSPTSCVSEVDETKGIYACSEVQVLNITFEACDTMGTGEVLASTVMQYLQDMTAQSPERGRLLMLYNMLDPYRQGVAVNRDTFHATMKRWIVECSQDCMLEEDCQNAETENNRTHTNGNELSAAETEKAFHEGTDGLDHETSDLINRVADLQYANQKLSEQNSSLLRAVEMCEEANLQLTDEIVTLKIKLTSSQQSVLNAKSQAEELEEAKRATIDCQERACRLQTSSSKLKRENESLNTKVQILEEMKENLKQDKELAKTRISELTKTKSEILKQLYEAQSLLAAKDAEITEKIKFIEELKNSRLENHKIIEGMHLELNRLQENSQQELLRCTVSLQSPTGQPGALPLLKSLQSEIEELQKQGSLEEVATPICGLLMTSSQQKDDFQMILQQIKSQEDSSMFQTEPEAMANDMKLQIDAFITSCQGLDVPDDPAHLVIIHKEELQKKMRQIMLNNIHQLDGLFTLKEDWNKALEKLERAYLQSQQQHLNTKHHLANVIRELELQKVLKDKAEERVSEQDHRAAEAEKGAKEAKKTATVSWWRAMKVEEDKVKAREEAARLKTRLLETEGRLLQAQRTIEEMESKMTVEEEKVKAREEPARLKKRLLETEGRLLQAQRTIEEMESKSTRLEQMLLESQQRTLTAEIRARVAEDKMAATLNITEKKVKAVDQRLAELQEERIKGIQAGEQKAMQALIEADRFKMEVCQLNESSSNLLMKSAMEMEAMKNNVSRAAELVSLTERRLAVAKERIDTAEKRIQVTIERTESAAIHLDSVEKGTATNESTDLGSSMVLSNCSSTYFKTSDPEKEEKMPSICQAPPVINGKLNLLREENSEETGRRTGEAQSNITKKNDCVIQIPREGNQENIQIQGKENSWASFLNKPLLLHSPFFSTASGQHCDGHSTARLQTTLLDALTLELLRTRQQSASYCFKPLPLYQHRETCVKCACEQRYASEVNEENVERPKVLTSDESTQTEPEDNGRSQGSVTQHCAAPNTERSSEDKEWQYLPQELSKSLTEQPAPDFAHPAPDLADPAPDLANPAPDLADPAPDLANPAPDLADPAPDLADPAPDLANPAPDLADPAPDLADPAPDPANPAPDLADPAPDLANPAPDLADPAPDLADPAPDPANPAPDLADPAPDLADPAPDLANPAPDLANPAPDLADPAPDLANPAPDLADPAPDLANPAPDLADPAPDLANPAPDLADPAPDLANPAPDLADPAPDLANPAPDLADPAPDLANPAPDLADPAPDLANPAPDLANPAPDLADPAPDLADPAPDPANPAPDLADPAPDLANPASRAPGPRYPPSFQTMPTLPEEEEEDEAAEEQDSSPPSPVVAVEARMVSAPSIVFPGEAVTANQEPNALSQSRPHSPRHRPRSSFSSASSITTVDSTGHVIDLVKDQLPDVKLSDKDTKKNLELLEEAKKVSERFFMRRGRRSTCSVSDSPTGVSPNLTPVSSPVTSRSSSLTQPPQIASDGTAVNSAGTSPTPQHLDVPSARGQTDSIGLDTESPRKGLVDRQVNEQWKISQGLLSPRHGSYGNSKEALSEQKENCDPRLDPPNTESRKLCIGLVTNIGEESPAMVQRSVEYNDCPSGNAQPQKSAAGAVNPGLKAPTKAHKDPKGACTAELKSFGSGPPLMRAVSWDGMEQASLRNGAQDLPTMTDKSFTLYDKSSSQLLKSTGYKDFPVQPVKTQKLVKLREENKLLRNQTMAGLKLPDLSETAEQERGPSPLTSLPPPMEEEPKEKSDVMPNISDVMLRKLKVLRSLPGSVPPLTEKEVENAFVQLSLAFRNDSYTLETRLRQAERERAQTEDNTDKELEDFKGVIKGSILQWQNCEQRESYERLLETIAVFHRLASRLSSRAEMVGAVRQEKRMSRATEVMMQYVENLKRTYEKDHAELIEYKKLANQNSSRYGAADSGEDGVPRASRSMSLTLGKALPRRRVSVAVVPKFNLLNISNQSPGAVTNTSLPTLCEVNGGRNSAPKSPVQPPITENGKTSQDQENATPVPAPPPCSRDEIRSEIKAKIEEDAYNKGYQEGLKRSKELQEVKEEEEKIDESQKEAEEKEKELEMEKEIENKKSSKFEEALDYIDRLCPKVFRQHRLVWIIAAVVVILAFIVCIFTSYNNSSTEVADTSPGKSVCSGKKQNFEWNVGLQHKNPTPE